MVSKEGNGIYDSKGLLNDWLLKLFLLRIIRNNNSWSIDRIYIYKCTAVSTV